MGKESAARYAFRQEQAKQPIPTVIKTAHCLACTTTYRVKGRYTTNEIIRGYCPRCKVKLQRGSL